MSSTQHHAKIKLLDQVRNLIRCKHYSYSTEKVYVYWIRNFILFNKKKHPKEMGAKEIKAYLTYLAKNRGVAASTQNQALNAIVFLYKKVLRLDPGNFDGALRAKATNYIPQIISREKILDIIDQSSGTYKLMIILLYGCGLRVSELFNLRIKDIDFDLKMVSIFMGKGNKNRTVMLPEFAIPYLNDIIKKNRSIYSADVKRGMEGVEMPNALERKMNLASKEWAWFWLFPAPRYSKDPRSGIIRRHHLHKTSLQKHVYSIRRKLKILSPITPHSFRHCFATHLLEDGKDISTVQRLLGHANIKTTMVYLHVLESRGTGVASPLDSFGFKQIIEKRNGIGNNNLTRNTKPIVKIKRASENKKGRVNTSKNSTHKSNTQLKINIIPEATALNAHLGYEHVDVELPGQHQGQNLLQVCSPQRSDFYPEQYSLRQSLAVP